MTAIGEMTIEEAAREAAGNWAKFECFVWHRERRIQKPEDWAIVYTHNRDSKLLDQSNAGVIADALKPFSKGKDPDVVFESHSHWAVGHVDGFSIRVFRRGGITKAFRVYHDLAERMADYPILDESDYSERECNATYANVGEAAWRLKKEFALPDDWQGGVVNWLYEHRSEALESVDDQGGWPDEDDLEAAFLALGYKRIE